MKPSLAYKRIRLFCIATACLSLPTLGAPGNRGNSGNSGNSGTAADVTIIGDESGNTVAKYHLSSWNVRGDYQIVGPVVMMIDGDFDIGNNNIEIMPSGSLELYIGANITVSGNGAVNNRGLPSQFIVIGTHPAKKPTESPDYTITLSGNGALNGVVYAPNAQYRTNGGGNAGQTSGAVVALDVRFNGSPGPFHYDEALEDLDLGFGDFKLSSYELKPNSIPAASNDGEAVFESSNYKSLFEQLFSSQQRD